MKSNTHRKLATLAASAAIIISGMSVAPSAVAAEVNTPQPRFNCQAGGRLSGPRSFTGFSGVSDCRVRAQVTFRVTGANVSQTSNWTAFQVGQATATSGVNTSAVGGNYQATPGH